jgi:hypothetical protein
VLRTDAPGAAPAEYGPWFKDDGQKITFSDNPATNAAGFSLNRYSGSLFQTGDLVYSPGRFIASCEPAGPGA